MIFIDPYGKEDKSKWKATGMTYFINSHIIPKLRSTEIGLDMWDYMDNGKNINPTYERMLKDIDIEKIIEKIVIPEELKLERENEKKGYRGDMTGFEYEEFCKTKMEEFGWQIAVTKKTGDQGIDLIATKKNRKVAVQCKKYSSPVGNKTVQEVVAGKLFYNLETAVVIANRSFTKSAMQLAKANSVLLLHHDEIDKI